MAVSCFRLLRNIGQFDSVDAGAQVALTKLTLLYAENGRGKTTLATILRSAATNNWRLVDERRRLGSQHPPHIVLATSAGQTVYQNNSWSVSLPQISVFDDAFVAANVCSGIAIETAHRQNLHELILGAQGVALNTALQDYIGQIEEHNRALRQREDAIPAAARGSLTVDAFCALPADPSIDDKIVGSERALAAAQAAEQIHQQSLFTPLDLPTFNRVEISTLLSRTLSDLEAAAAAHVRAHLQSIARGGEAWISDGMSRVIKSGASVDGFCPFCAQELQESSLIRHYQVYFGTAYKDLKSTITETGRGINETHGGEAPAAFERWVRVTSQLRDFWRDFTNIPAIDVDTAEIMRAWVAARDAMLKVLRVKAAAPIEALSLSAEVDALVEAYERNCAIINNLSIAMRSCNLAIAIVKEQAANANIETLQADLTRLRVIKARHDGPSAAFCQNYLTEKAAKVATEHLRNQARVALNNYRQNIFPVYEGAINDYLRRFNAGFRLGSVGSINTRGGSSCTYNVVINNVAVTLTADQGPSFRNTLSAGDRNTLALAFFFTSLDHDAQIGQKIVVIDDPMTSLDEHRALTTVQEMRKLQARVDQMIVLSHSKPFLCGLWEGADPQERSAARIVRAGAGSTLAAWDVRQDCITEHDHRHELVEAYLRAGNPTTERQVAEALRPIIEAFLRVAYPKDFPPGTLLGPFLGVCQQRVSRTNQILRQTDIDEIRALMTFVNRYHHDTNPAWQTAAVNDQELVGFARRTLMFSQRG